MRSATHMRLQCGGSWRMAPGRRKLEHCTSSCATVGSMASSRHGKHGKAYMLQVARDGQYESLVKALPSGLRLAKKMSFIPAIMVLAVWLFAESLERLRI